MSTRNGSSPASRAARALRPASLGGTLLLALLLGADPAWSDGTTRRGGTATTGIPNTAALQAAAAAQTSTTTQSAIRSALASIQLWKTNQDAARALALQAESSVPNGLVSGGLELATGTGEEPVNVSSVGSTTSSDGKVTVDVVQSDERAILTWNTFNVGKNTTLEFDQSKGGDSATSWVVLNRVLDGNTSQILGSIQATGQVYILNHNGILFGGSSQVNVGTLVVSAKDLAAGELSRYQVGGTLSNLEFSGAAGKVTVEPGAELTAGSYGRVMLIGSEVTNGGAITAPDGEVILIGWSGASDLQLAARDDERGLQVGSTPAAGNGGGIVTNTGSISADRGIITLFAGTTNQDGLVTATTGAEANGIITLGGPGGITTLGAGSVTQILADDSGVKVVGSGSSFKSSVVNVYGDEIYLLDGATIYAPSGNVSLVAQMQVDPTGSWTDDSKLYIGTDARIDVSGLQDVEVAMEQNSIQAVLHASELADNPVVRDGSLRGKTVYFDARLGYKPSGDDGVADLSAYYDLVEHDVKEMMTAGGKVTLTANQVVTREGSVIDLSGGSLEYLSGYIKHSYLVDTSGNRVAIEDAVSGVDYVGVDGDAVVSHSRWGVTQVVSPRVSRTTQQYVEGYEQGGSAGTLTVNTADPAWYTTYKATHDSAVIPASPSATGLVRIFDGSVVATTVAGTYQREVNTGSTDPTEVWKEQPKGATLELDNAGDVTIAATTTQLASGYDPYSWQVDAAQQYQVVLPTSWFDGETFQHVTINSGYDPDAIANSTYTTAGTVDRASGGHLTIGEGVVVDLGDGGSFSFTGKGVELDGTLLAAGGKVSLKALQVGEDGAAPSIHVSSTGSIDVAGRLSNATLDDTSDPLRALNGGSVSLTATQVLLDAGSLVDVSGGARLNASGTKVTAGNAGAITIDVSNYPSPSAGAADAFSGTLQLEGTLAGYALAVGSSQGKGGSLTIRTGGAVELGEGVTDSDGTGFSRSSAFFTEGGFASYSIVGEQGVTVTGDLAPTQLSLIVPEHLAELQSGTRLEDVSAARVLEEGQGNGMTLSLSTEPTRTARGVNNPITAVYQGNLVVDAGVTISMSQPGSTVSLTSQNRLEVDGVVEAPGGTISLTTTAGTVQQVDPGIVLGASAVLDAEGYQKLTPLISTSDRTGSAADGYVRSVESGGTITLSSTTGVEIADTAVLDVHGISAVADLAVESASGGTRYTARTVEGDAGSITISAATGVVSGDLRLAAGGDAGSGGSLIVTNVGTSGVLVVAQSAGATTDPAKLTVIADSVDGSGADSVELRAAAPTDLSSPSTLEFAGDVTLSAHRSLTLVSDQLTQVGGANVTLAARQVTLEGSSKFASQGSVATTGLGGSLTIDAVNGIDVLRTVVLGCVPDATCPGAGFETVTFVAGGDIRLSDHDADSHHTIYAGLFAGGALVLDSAQVYVTSRYQQSTDSENLALADDDPGFLVEAGTSITVKGNGNEASVPLSYGGRLTLRAPSIDQGGVVRAPEGDIRLEAQDADGTPGTLTLEAGSLTSTSLEDTTVLYGETLSDGTFSGYDVAGQSPSSSVHLTGSAVDVKAGAVVDVSGGGDVEGYAFVSGNGGTKDILAQSGTYAILPSLHSGTAPIGGTKALSDSTLKVGDTVHLVGVPGLADGDYLLLPAHYALLPGAYLVKSLGGSLASAPASYTRADGAVVAAGYLGVSGTSSGDPSEGGAGWSRFLVMSQSTFLKYSELDTYSFTSYATGLASEAGVTVRTPNDGGSVVVEATKAISLDGTGKLEGGKGGLLGNLDISSSKLAVLGSGVDSASYSDYVILDAQSLSSFGAGSVLLGGVRGQTGAATSSSGAAGTAVTVNATDVVVDTGGEVLTFPELLLVAEKEVRVADGSVVKAAAPSSGSASTDTNLLIPVVATSDPATAGIALLRLSVGGRIDVASPTDASGDLLEGLTGDLSIGKGVTLSAEGSMRLQGSQLVSLDRSASLSTPQLDLSSQRVNLGDAPADAAGTTLDAALVTALASSSELLIQAGSGIYLYGDLTLGSRSSSGDATMSGLTLDSGLVEGEGGTVQLTAGQLTLRNSSGTSSSAQATASQGTLQLDVDTLALGTGTVQLAGFSQVMGKAGVMEAQGSGELLVRGSLGSADAALAVGRLQTASGVGYTLAVDGAAWLGPNSGAGTLADVTSLGGQLTLEAASVSLDTAVVLPGGSFTATATTGGLAVGSEASIDVSGRAVDLEGAVRFAPGGTIRLSAGSAGDLTVASGAALDVSASDTGGDAGAIELSAGGKVTVSGTLGGAADTAAGYSGGSFTLDAGSLSSFSDLNSRLETGGFTRSRELRLRSGDIELAAGESLTAHDVVLRSDAGEVIVEGTIAAAGDASHANGGTVELIGGTGVELGSTARVDASAAGSSDRGGEVTLWAVGGAVRVAGAAIDVSGASGSGAIAVRALATDDGGVQVTQLDGTFTGAGEKVIQAVKSYQATVIDDPLAGELLAGASSWLAAAREAHPDGLYGFTLAPGILVTSDGDLALDTTISLGGQSGHGFVGLVAKGGSLTIGANAALSDGFSSADRAATLLQGRSSDYLLEAAGDVTLAKGALVRTGTGDITLRAGGDLTLQDNTSVIYTAGSNSQGSAAAVSYYPEDGGDVTIEVAGDIVAQATTQSTSAWLFRQGKTTWDEDTASFTVNTATSWSIAYQYFEQAVGALGGGRVRVSAGGDIEDLQVAIPTNGQLTTAKGAVAQESDLVTRGGGDLQVTAGGDIVGGLYVLGAGQAELRAGGSVRPTDEEYYLRTNSTSSSGRTAQHVGLLIGLMDGATASVTAGADVTVEAAFDPMLQGQTAASIAAAGGTGSAFYSYGDDASLEATSVGGTVSYENDPWASVDMTLDSAAFQVSMSGSSSGTSLNDLFSYAPPSLHLVSLASSVTVEDRAKTNAFGLTLTSAPEGTLELLAAGDVHLAVGKITLKDVAPEYAYDVLHAFSYTSAGVATLGISEDEGNNYRRGSTLLHQDDPDPVRIYAGGSVCAQTGGVCKRGKATKTNLNAVTVTAPKPIEVIAGVDVLGGQWQPQNNSSSDVSLIQAGRDVYDPILEVTGQGTAIIQAGRDVVLDDVPVNSSSTTGVSAPVLAGGAIYSLGSWTPAQGNTAPTEKTVKINSALSGTSAADVIVLAGTANGVDYAGFAAAYLDPANGQGVVRTYLAELRKYMDGLDGAKYAALSDAELYAAFQALSLLKREIFLDQVYFTELKETGIDYNDSSSTRYRSYDRGYEAVSLLFPTDPTTLTSAQRGDIVLAGKQVETEADASITLLAPYGSAQVGESIVAKGVDSTKGGVVTRRGGDISVMADGNIDLYTSRVFTDEGGDILMWTTDGSITAGSGSSTSVRYVPLTYTMDASATVEVDAFGLVTGAGIGVLDALGNAEGRTASRLDLIAPHGEVNAGDAGIRVVGDLNIAAQTVVGLENIKVSGTATGIPKVEVPSMSVASTANEMAQTAAREGLGPDPLAAQKALAELPSIITVEVVGYETTDQGDENGDPAKKRKPSPKAR